MVRFEVKTVGTFKKLADKTAVPGVLPNKLNETIEGTLPEELDLTLGAELFKDEGAGDVFDSFFDYLLQTKKEETVLRQAIGADFVSNRRNLQYFMTIPYWKNEDVVEIQAIRYKDVIFLCKKEEADSFDYPNGYGYKFEQYITFDENGKLYDKNGTPKNDTCTKAVFQTSLNSGNETIRILYAAEIDAIDSEGKFVEIKTTSKNHTKWLRFQSLPHYLQSLLGNVPTIVYGRTKDNMVYKVEKIKTDSIPGLQKFWKKKTCLESLFSILHTITSKLEFNNEALLIRITKKNISFDPEPIDKCVFLQNSPFLQNFE